MANAHPRHIPAVTLEERIVHARSRLRLAIMLLDIHPEDRCHQKAVEARQAELDRLLWHLARREAGIA